MLRHHLGGGRQKFQKVRLEISQVKQNHMCQSRLGSRQYCTLRIEISHCYEFGFFGQLSDVYRKIFLTSLIISQNKAIRFCFFPYSAGTMSIVQLSVLYSSKSKLMIISILCAKERDCVNEIHERPYPPLIILFWNFRLCEYCNFTKAITKMNVQPYGSSINHLVIFWCY